MEVIFNNKIREIDEGTTLAQLVAEFKREEHFNRVGAFVNQKLVRETAYERTILKEGDRVSVRKLAGGG